MQLRNGSAHAPPKHLDPGASLVGAQPMRDGVVLKSRTARGYYVNYNARYHTKSN
jgi:hypothetical protein